MNFSKPLYPRKFVGGFKNNSFFLESASLMTKRGWEIVKNHLIKMNRSSTNYDDIILGSEDKPIFANSKDGIKLLTKKDIHCNDCPHPCI